MAAFHEVGEHGQSHGAGTDKAYVHCVSPGDWFQDFVYETTYKEYAGLWIIRRCIKAG
jgi:hypothetical protein